MKATNSYDSELLSGVLHTTIATVIARWKKRCKGQVTHMVNR
ncbi:putative recombinase [Salmonella phage 21]|nr:putative recombinase [Salmonella phage 21]